MTCLYGSQVSFGFDPDLDLPLIDEVAFVDCNEGVVVDPNQIVAEDPECACEQSTYWASQYEADCPSYNIMYWYHPDYLGSVEAVTDIDGEVYQFFHNTIWGEDIVSQKSYLYNHYSSPYRFNGKEKDWETGNYYYGARYYDPKLSVWLSVDRLASKYPGWSPYNFTMNNPLNLIDPNGDSVNYASWKERLHVGAMRLLSSEFREQFSKLKSSENMYTYVHGSQDPKAYGEIEFVGYGKAKNELYEIRYDLVVPNDPHGRSKWHALFEETFHAADFESGNPNMNFHRKNGKTFVGSVQGDRSVEARAWIFAGLHAPFAPKQPSARDAQTGGNMLFMNSLVQQIKAGATQTQVENALYNGYLLNYETWDAGVLLNKETFSKSLTKQY